MDIYTLVFNYNSFLIFYRVSICVSWICLIFFTRQQFYHSVIYSFLHMLGSTYTGMNQSKCMKTNTPLQGVTAFLQISAKLKEKRMKAHWKKSKKKLGIQGWTILNWILHSIFWKQINKVTNETFNEILITYFIRKANSDLESILGGSNDFGQ